MIKATLNGRALQFEDGLTILDACRSIDVHIPTLCNDPRLKPIGSYRMCLVQVEGRPRPLTSCNTHLADGMVISTHTPALEHERQTLLHMLAREHPANVFRRFPEKPFHRLALQYGLTEAYFDGVHREELLDDSHHYIHVDMSQCILCYRCVRICDEIQGQFVWQIFNQGHETRIVPDSGSTLVQSSCVSCGACVDTCPTGALEDKSILERGIVTAWTRTTCAYCGTGCEMEVGTTNNHLVSIKPVFDAPVSKGHPCVKGRYAFEFVTAKDRVIAPMIRMNDEWQTVTWEEAISLTVNKLQQIVSDHGPDSVAIVGSARGTNEENYLAQKFARVVIGTNNVDCCARVCHTPTAAAMKLRLGAGAATNSYDDIEQAQTILLCGANATENHPIIGARIKEAALHGARIKEPPLDLASVMASVTHAARLMGLIAFTLVTGPLPEEMGWRGYLLDEFQARYHAVSAALMIGVHLPGYSGVFHGMPASALQMLFLTLSMSIIYTSIYNHTERSVLAVILERH